MKDFALTHLFLDQVLVLSVSVNIWLLSFRDTLSILKPPVKLVDLIYVFQRGKEQ
jgi:hypothetical protein